MTKLRWRKVVGGAMSERGLTGGASHASKHKPLAKGRRKEESPQNSVVVPWPRAATSVPTTRS